MKQYITNSWEETKDLGKKMAKDLRGVVALSGILGAGKTTFAQGFAQGLGIKEKIISPTFIIVRQHKIPKTKNTLFHIDLYRVENSHQIKHLGLEDFFADSNNLVLIEWAEKAKNMLPKYTTWIKFENIGESKRKIEIS